MTDIPITANERKAQFTGNTGLGPFAFTFNILASSDIRVIKNNTVLTLTSEYTIATNADGTGSVTLTGSGNGTALIASDVLTIIGNRQLARTSDYVQGGNLFAEALNEDLDSVVIMMQQLDEKVSRTMRVDAGDVAGDLLIPAQSVRANKYLAFGTDGEPIATAGTTSSFVVSAFAETFLDDNTGTEVLTTLGVTSTPAELNILDGVTASTAEINLLDGVTASTAELNILDGVTASTAELNILDGVLASTAELNLLNGVTATTAELNILDGVTATAAELNVMDGIAGIASQAEAEAGVATNKLMTPERTKQAIDAQVLDGVGIGQTWATASRTAGVSYQNTTGGPIQISLTLIGTSTGGESPVITPGTVEISTNGSTWVTVISTGGAGDLIAANVIVPNNHYYRYTNGTFYAILS